MTYRFFNENMFTCLTSPNGCQSMPMIRSNCYIDSFISADDRRYVFELNPIPPMAIAEVARALLLINSLLFVILIVLLKLLRSNLNSEKASHGEAVYLSPCLLRDLIGIQHLVETPDIFLQCLRILIASKNYFFKGWN